MTNKKNKNNATCITCGKGYHLCMACERSKSTWKYWKMLADSENCYKIYQVVNDYNFNKISKNEAKNLLEKLDLTELDTFRVNIKEKIIEIMKTKKQHSKNRKFKVDEVNVENENIVEETIEENVVETIE